MTNEEYQKLVEKKFNKPLKDIMYDLCVEKDMIASEGAHILDVPSKVFVGWRNKFRFGPLQRCADEGERRKKDKLDQYKNELQSVDINRKFIYDGTQSLDGFKEMMERLLEIKKLSMINNDYEGLGNLTIELNIMTIEQIISYLDLYLSGQLCKQIENETKSIR